MAVSASTSTIVMMMMLVIATSAVVVATTASVVMIATSAATTAASACHVLNQVLNLLLGSLAILNHATLEVQSLTSQRVVGINCYTVFLNLCYLSHKLVVFVVHQCDNGALKDILVVKMPVNCKYLAAHLMHALSYIFAKSLCRSQLKVKVATFLQGLYLGLESIECYTESCDKLKWTLVASLLFQLALTVFHAVQLVDHRHKSVFCFFHIPIYIYYLVSACKDTHFPPNSCKFNPKI